MSDGEVLIRAEHVSKKFCRSFRRSLWYGTQDVFGTFLPWKQNKSSRETGASEQYFEPELRNDEFWAVQDVSFEVRRGECLGLIGHNGAGKSTLLKMLNNLYRPDTGCITMKGSVGALIELSSGFNPVLTGRENIYNQAALLGFSKKETDAKFDAIVDFSEIEGFLDAPVQNYSSGMRVRLGFAVAAQMEPDVLLIDEVLAVGDVAFRFKCINKMAELMNRSAVIFVSHTMPQILRVCNSLMVLEKGRVAYQGDDLSKGVDAYYKNVVSQEQSIVGSGEVELKSITLSATNRTYGDDGVLELQYGDSLEIELTLFFDQHISHGVVQVLFWNMEMLPVLDLIGPELNGFPISNVPTGKHTVRARLDNISLNSGNHFLTVVVSEPGFSKVYMRHDNAAVVRILTRTPSGAQSVTSGEWRHIREN